MFGATWRRFTYEAIAYLVQIVVLLAILEQGGDVVFAVGAVTFGAFAFIETLSNPRLNQGSDPMVMGIVLALVFGGIVWMAEAPWPSTAIVLSGAVIAPEFVPLLLGALLLSIAKWR